MRRTRETVLELEGPTRADSASVEMRGIWKRFPGVVANRNVDLDLRPGEVHALLGENGAGKSTLMHILSGMYRCDAGTITINGTPVDFKSPAQAIAAGIGMVHQHFRLVETQTVAENIHLGWRETPRSVSQRTLAERTRRLCDNFGLRVDADALIWQLSTGEQQRVEILRVLARGARVLILDEPTSVLTPSESAELFRSIRLLASTGRTVVLISHKLDEVLAVSDRVTVLRNGRVVATRLTPECDKQTLARLLIGQDIVSRLARAERPPGQAVLEVRDAQVLSDRGLAALRDLNLVVRSGEILGIAGVAGNGQTELALVVTGMRPLTKGSVRVAGQEVSGLSPEGFAAAGVGHIPEDRLGVGLAGSLSIIDNAVLREYLRPPISTGFRLDGRAAAEFTRELVARAAVQVSSIHTPVRHLSGGNQQRLLAGRETRVASKLLVAMHPTQGLDVGATEELRRVLMEYRNNGGAVLLISEDLDEVLIMSDRIAVMFGGSIVGEFHTLSADRAEIGLLMGGARTQQQGEP
jgi:general nucleoside transport system ATP-binding protein